MADSTIVRRVQIFSLTIISIALFSTLGYIIIKFFVEDQRTTLVEAFYWTIVTLSTLGAYGNGAIAFESEIGLAFTTIVVIIGLGVVFLGTANVIGPWMEDRIRVASLPPEVSVPKGGHVIICCHSELTREVLQDLDIHNVEHIFIEKDPPEEMTGYLNSREIPHILGDPTKSETLLKANIEKAMSLIVLGSDSTNAFICLTAKKIRPDIHIISSVSTQTNEKILLRAGATKVISPWVLAGIKLADQALHRHDVSYVGEVAILGELGIHEYAICEDSPLAGQTLFSAGIAHKTGATIIGIRREDELKLTPSPYEKIKPGSILLVMGTSKQIDSFKAMLAPPEVEKEQTEKGNSHRINGKKGGGQPG